MALWGFVFWGLGGVIVSIFWLLLAIVSYIITFIGCFFSETFIVEWHSKFHDWTMVETSVPLCISLIMGAVFAWGVTEDRARKTKEDPQARLNVIQKIAASDNIQLLLIESSRKQLRVMLTLKSR
ncbi:hypothetical protein JGK42_003897, partial [Aeromonas veronii]|nr:hypothetical protein [Aeromonas veronii]